MSVHAQDENASKAAFENGVLAMQTRDYEAAVIAFKSSLALREHPAARCNLALALEGRAGEERSHARRVAHKEQARESYLICASTDESGRYAAHAKQRAALIVEEIERDANSHDANSDGEDERQPEQLADRAETQARVDPVEQSIDPTRQVQERDDDDEGGPWLAISLVSYGVAAAAFGGGVAFALDAQSRKAEIDRQVGAGPAPTTIEGMPNPVLDEIDSYDRSRDIALGFYASAVLLATLGTSFLIIELLSDDVESGERAAISIGPGVASLRASF